MLYIHILGQVLKYDNVPKVQANNTTLSTIVSMVLAIAGSISLLMIVIGGLRYILAHGDPSATAQAKNTILYAIIGLLVSMMAFGIVAFVLGKVG